MTCYYWVIDPYRDRFRGTFHQAKLRPLADIGFLRELYSVRGGRRRYYAIENPDGVEQLLNAWRLN